MLRFLYKLDRERLRRSSSIFIKQYDYHKIVNQRLKVLAIVMIVVFSLIALQLFNIQILRTEEYSEKLVAYTSKKQVSSTPRGQMYDRNGELLVASLESHDIIYYPPKDISEQEEWELAESFAVDFQIGWEHLTFVDLKNLYISLHKDENGKKDWANHLLSEEEYTLLSKGNESEKREIEQKKLDRITMEMIDEIADDKMKSTYAVKVLMDQVPENESKIIIEDASNEQVAYLLEHIEKYKGFDVDFGSWKRQYPYGNTLRDVLGRVTTTTQGLPEENREYYQAKGYALNERVGYSGLEKQYEDLLRGTRKVSEITYDQDIASFKEIVSGKKGYDLQLSIDIDLQKKVDDILYASLERAKRNANRPDYKKAFVVLMNPETGEIYAMSGMLVQENGEIIPYASGNYLDSNAPGSVVKGATLYMGLNEGVVKPGEVIVDAPMCFIGTPCKASFNNYGAINDIQSLAKSSNVYMFHIAIRLGGGVYVPNGPLYISNPAITFALMRNYYSQFGLGVLTGIDVPDEQTGFIGYSQDGGKVLDFAIGQYDSYTPLQLAQYVATIANNGVKVQPRLVTSAYDVNSSAVIFENKVNILSDVYGDHNYFQRIQEGFKQCVDTTFCGVEIKNVNQNIAAKTGTAEVYVNGRESVNSSIIGYGPYKNPKVAFACVAPTSSNVSNLQENVCSSEIMGDVLAEFFKKY